MCDPVIMAGASLAMGAMSSYQQSNAAKQSADYQAAVNRNNAQISEWQAQDSIKRGEVAEHQQRLRTKQMKGSQTARLAANGIDISDGSALNILSDTDWMGEQDALNVRDNAAREAYAYRQQGANSSANAGLLKFKSDSENPLMAAGTSVLTNPALGTVTGAVSKKWYSMSASKTKPLTGSFTTPSSAWA